MLALSLWRPWPWAFAHVGKPVENRRWPMPRYLAGQELAMHAALRFDEPALLKMREGAFGEAAQAVPATQHPTGVVGVFTFVDCVPLGDIDIDDPLAVTWSFGPWCWRVKPGSVRMLPVPIACPGRQGLWQLPRAVEEDVRRQLEAAA